MRLNAISKEALIISLMSTLMMLTMFFVIDITHV